MGIESGKTTKSPAPLPHAACSSGPVLQKKKKMVVCCHCLHSFPTLFFTFFPVLSLSLSATFSFFPFPFTKQTNRQAPPKSKLLAATRNRNQTPFDVRRVKSFVVQFAAAAAVPARQVKWKWEEACLSVCLCVCECLLNHKWTEYLITLRTSYYYRISKGCYCHSCCCRCCCCYCRRRLNYFH